jgi:hypothetical protein
MAVRKFSRGRGYAFDRALIEMAKTMDLNAIAKKTGRTPAGILKTVLRLGISIKGLKEALKRVENTTRPRSWLRG